MPAKRSRGESRAYFAGVIVRPGTTLIENGGETHPDKFAGLRSDPGDITRKHVNLKDSHGQREIA